MRIFSTYRELTEATQTEGFRYSPECGPAGFVCDHCGAVKVLSGTIPGSQPFGAVGYAIVGAKNNGRAWLEGSGRMVCYDCADAMQLEELQARPDRFCGYISSDGSRLTSWTGGTLGRVVSHSSHRNNFGAVIHCYSIRDAFGRYWHGRNAGRGMCITIRPSKD